MNKYIDPRFEETPLCDDEVVVLSTLGKGPKGDKGEKGDPITDEALYDTVAEYIEDHPGYVTTLMDGAVIERKLDPTLSLELCRCFDTVADMQEAIDLKAGMVCHTNGFHSAGDGGAAFYEVTADGEPNDMDVLALQNGLYATLVVAEPYVTPEMFGAYGDGANDDYATIQRAIGFFDNGGIVKLSNKKYVIGSTLKVPNFTTLEGSSATPISKSPYATFLDDIGSVIYLKDGADCNMLEVNDIEDTLGITIRNIVFYGNRSNQSQTSHGIYFEGGTTAVRSGSLFENVIVSWCNGSGLVFDKNQSAIKFNNVWSMKNSASGIVMNGDDLQATKWGAGNNDQYGLVCDNGRGSIRSFDSDFFGNDVGVYIKNTSYMKFYNLISQNNNKEGLLFESTPNSANGRIDIIGGFIGNNSQSQSGSYSDVHFSGTFSTFPVNFTNVTIGTSATAIKPKYAIEFSDTLSNVLAITTTCCVFYRNNTFNAVMTNNTSRLNMVNCVDVTTAKAMPNTLPYEIDVKPFARQIMYDVSSKKVSLYNGQDWINDTIKNYQYINAAHTVTDSEQFVLCGGTTDYTITLPETAVRGKTFEFVKYQATGVISFAGANGTETAGKTQLSTQYDCVRCTFAGATWICY